MDFKKLFIKPQDHLQKRYEAIRCFFVEERSAEWIAKQYGYTITTVSSLTFRPAIGILK